MFKINNSTKNFLEKMAEKMLREKIDELTEKIDGTEIDITLIKTNSIKDEFEKGEIISEELFFQNQPFHVKRKKKASHS